MDNGEGKFKVKIKMDKNLTISVVIPAYNEEENIGRLLDALQRQTRIPDEVIVVDDGSNDRRDAYLKTSGYNSAIPVHFGGDVEFWRRLNKEGKCVHDTSIVARHNSGYKWKAVGIAIVISGAILVAGMVVGY